MIRTLYAPRPHPYYIYAPDYRRSSAGIRVLHMLCDALNRSGYEAYVTTQLTAPHLNTPFLTEAQATRHRSAGVEPIVLYPEVFSGNPLGASVIVRYLLNELGHLQKTEPFGEDDLLFVFSRGLLLPGIPDENVLFLQQMDRGVFKPPADPAKRIPGKVCYYLGRQRRPIPPHLLPPDAIEITLSYPDSWEGLVEIFQTCEYFYSAATSALAAEAALCGCVAVFLPGAEAPLNFSEAETGGHGVAWGVSAPELARARATLPLLHELLERREAEFWPALDHFIEVTQRAANRQRVRKHAASIPGRLARRDTQAQALLAAAGAGRLGLPAIAAVVIEAGQGQYALTRTLRSLSASLVPVQALQVPAFSVAAVNHAIASSACEWFLVLRAGEELTQAGLLMTARALATAPEQRAVYTDLVTRVAGETLVPWLRPDVNLDLLLALPSAFSSHWLLRRDLWAASGGFSQAHPQAFELEYLLRLLEADGLTGLGHVSEPLVLRDAVAVEPLDDERAVIEQYVRRRGFSEAEVAGLPGGRYEIDYGHGHQPAVSILLAVDGQLPFITRCLESLMENTAYQNFEVLLLDRGNQEPATVAWLAGIEGLGVEQLRVLRYAHAAPLQALYNDGAQQAHGEFVVVLDGRAAVVGSDWLHQLLNHAMRPEVGCVGPLLVDGDGKVLHAAAVLGLGDVQGEPFRGQQAGQAGYMGRQQVDQGCSALSGHCLMLRRQQFIDAGGLDDGLAGWATTELCLKFIQAGYLNIWAPRARLLLTEQAPEPVPAEATAALYQRWLGALARDPAYNPNLSLTTAFVLSRHAWPMPASLVSPTVPTVLGYTRPTQVDGCARLAGPFEALQRNALVSGELTERWLTVMELARYAPDALVIQRAVAPDQLAAMANIQAFSEAFTVYELDRYLPEAPGVGFHAPAYGQGVLWELRQAVAAVDRLVVATPMLANVFDGYHGDTRVLQTRLDPVPWGALAQAPRRPGKPRVALAARGATPQDLELLTEVVTALAGQVDWVLIGYCPPWLRPWAREIHNDADDGYPLRLAALGLDLAVLPLRDTLLNRCKGHERLLEFGACGVPVLASDLEPYQGGFPVTLVKEGTGPWLQALGECLADLDATRAAGARLQAHVREHWLLGNAALLAWRAAWLPG